MFAALIVDENPLTIMQAIDVLARAGLLSYACHSPETALPILERNQAQIRYLFISAERLSLMDGFALAKIAAVRWPAIDLVVASEQRRPGYGNLPESATFFARAFSAPVVEERLQQLGVRLNAEGPRGYHAQEDLILASFSEWPA